MRKVKFFVRLWYLWHRLLCHSLVLAQFYSANCLMLRKVFSMDQAFTDKNFEKTDFKETPFIKGEYDNCNFNSCDLFNADLSETRFIDCNFIGCNLCLVKLNNTVFRDTKFKECKMLGLRFDDCNEYGLSFSFEDCVLNHSSFYGKNIPVLFFFTGTHADYHKPSDTAEKVNYLGLHRIMLLVRDLARSLAQSSTRPTYAVAKSSGSMGQVRLSVSLGTIPSYGDTSDGMILDGVRDNSPASKAGLKTGDKIVKLAGKDVRNAMDYTYVLGSMKPGEEYEIELIRGTERMKLKIIPAAAARRP